MLISDARAAGFAVATNFFAPNFGLPAISNPGLSSIANTIRTNTGIDPDAYALSVYDAVWVIAKTLSSYPTSINDFSKLKTDFATEANQYYGITGPVVLNANGDREIGTFDYWGITQNAGLFQWSLVGKSE